MTQTQDATQVTPAQTFTNNGYDIQAANCNDGATYRLKTIYNWFIDSEVPWG